MPASQESGLEHSPIDRLGIIAGSGCLPEKLLHACDKEGIEVFVVGFEGQTDRGLLQGRNHVLTRLGAAGQIINTLKSHNIHHLVMIGAIRRPSLLELKPDLRTAQFFAKLGLKSLGDNDLLTALKNELQDEGFEIHGVQRFVHNLLAGDGPVGKYKPKQEDWKSITRGVSIIQELGNLDIGQAAVVQDDIVLGVEAIEGTDELIKRCTGYKRQGRGPVLVKLCKPTQDMDLDLPTIGPDTIKNCARAGFSGIVIEAGRSLLINPQDIALCANQYKMFVHGLTEPYKNHAS